MTTRDGNAPDAEIVSLDEHRHRQRVPTLSAAEIGSLAAEVIATDLASMAQAALGSILHAAFGLPVGCITATNDSHGTGCRLWPPMMTLDATAVGRLTAFAAWLKEQGAPVGEPGLSAHATRVLAVLSSMWGSVPAIASLAGLDTADTRRALRELDRRGMAMHAGDEWRRA